MIDYTDPTLTILNQKLTQAGIPFVSISGNKPPYIIEFAPEATQAQRDQAAVILAAFDPAAEVTAFKTELQTEKTDLGSLNTDINKELDWITTAIAEIDTGLGLVDAAQLAGLRAIVKGLLQNQRRNLLEQRMELKAWRYVVRQLVGR